MLNLNDLVPHFGHNVSLIIDGIEKKGTFSAIRSGEIEFCGEWIKARSVGQIEVIASRYKAGMICSNRQFEGYFLSKKQAEEAGNIWRNEGYSVILRPNYNELDGEGKRFFREWRSFNGEPFKEVVFKGVGA